MKKNKKILASLIVVITIGVVIGGVFFLDRLKFTGYFNEANIIAHSIYNIKEQSESSYCQRNNLKYSSGSLACSVEMYVAAKKYPDNSSRIEKALKDVGWVKRGSNLSLWSSVDNTYKSATLYKRGDIDCYIRIQEKQLNEQYFTIGCSGPAKAEWFTVREN